MSSTIDTDNIDVNFPIPGQDNDSQGFRDNFYTIRDALDAASAEITDLQTSRDRVDTLAHLVLTTDTIPSGWEGTGHYLPVTDLLGATVADTVYQIVKKST